MSKYVEYYIPVTTVLTEALESIRELIDNDSWRDIGQASPVTLKAIYDVIEDTERAIEDIEDELLRSVAVQQVDKEVRNDSGAV